MSADLYRKILDEELQKLGGVKQGHYGQATEILDSLILSPTFSEFLTIPAYKYLD
jgi:malate synthase